MYASGHSGILLIDFLNQAICCRVLFGTSAGCLGAGIFWREGMEEMGRGSQQIAIPWDKNLTEGGMEGKAKNPRSHKFIRNPIVSYPESHCIYPDVIRNACGSQI